MIPKTFKQEIRLEDGRVITLETGKLAKQADGSVVVRMGDCMLLATAVSARKQSPVDFLPSQLIIEKSLLLQENFLAVFLREKRVLVMVKYLL